MVGVPDAGVELVLGFGGRRLEIFTELHSVQPTGHVIFGIHLMGTSVVNLKLASQLRQVNYSSPFEEISLLQVAQL